MSERGQVHELQDLVLRRLAELGAPGSPMSLRQATERGRGLVNYETLRKISRAEHSGRISDQTAEGISLALDVPVSQVYAAARVPQPTSRWQWPAKFDRLDLAQRRVVESVASGFLEAYEKGLRDAQ